MPQWVVYIFFCVLAGVAVFGPVLSGVDEFHLGHVLAYIVFCVFNAICTTGR